MHKALLLFRLDFTSYNGGVIMEIIMIAIGIIAYILCDILEKEQHLEDCLTWYEAGCLAEDSDDYKLLEKKGLI